jgi:PAS domain S-box-containing protein
MEAARNEGGDDLYRRHVRAGCVGARAIGLDRKFIRVNRRMTEILGYSEAELKKLTGREISHPDDVDMINRLPPRAVRGPRRVGCASRSATSKKAARRSGWRSPSSSSATRPAKPRYEIAVFDDITARKRAEAAMRESEERFARPSSSPPSGMAHVTLDGHFLRVNRSLCQILGYTKDELVGRSVKELSHPDDRDLTDASGRACARARSPTRASRSATCARTAPVVWVDLAIALACDATGEPEYEIAVFDDITSRKVLDAAAARQDRAAAARPGRGAHDHPRLTTINGNHLTWSDNPEWLRGPLPASGEYPQFKDQVHPEDREQFILSRKRTIDTLEPGTQEYRVVRTDGQVVWVLARRQILTNESGKGARLLVAMIDITERKHGEAALRESEARFRSLTQLSADWYWEQDAQFGLTFMSGRMGERTGLDATAYLGRKRWDQPALNLTEADWDRHRGQLERHEPFRDFEMQRPMPDGASRWISVSGEPVFDEEGRFRRLPRRSAATSPSESAPRSRCARRTRS